MDADAVKVLRRLERHGYIAYLVGGGVRDLLLDRRPKDFDVATDARPGEVKRLFRNCRVIGRRFRLAHILFSEGKIIECATFRRDPGQDEDGLSLDDGDDDDLLIRHDNHFGEPHEDAFRRDFTINGLFYDIRRGEVIDYVGGMADLERRIVRTIGDPSVRFREDPVRILRAIKFSARLDMGIDREVYRAVLDHRGELAKAAKPRVLEELLRLLRGGAAHRSIFLTLDMGVLGEVLPGLAESLDPRNDASELVFQRLRMIDELRADGELPSDAVLLAALFSGAYEAKLAEGLAPSAAIAEVLDEPSERLALPRRLRDRITTIVLVQKRLRAGRFSSLVRRDFFADGAALHVIDRMAQGEPVPDWAIDPPAPDELPEDAMPRRRRRRRRR
ncbi:MAG: polynucleotide adenylyltransferase PcnB [Myxococcales bacterium]|nr:polynucleotide adenylyltransferase PcnB [Myxococcales bacterium]